MPSVVSLLPDWPVDFPFYPPEPSGTFQNLLGFSGTLRKFRAPWQRGLQQC